MSKNNLTNEIIVYAQNYTLGEGLKAFVKGVVNQKLTKELTFLYKNVDNNVLHFLKENNIRTYNVEFLDKQYNVNVGLSMYTLKTVYFYLYSKHVSLADNLLLTDCSDVYFNKNPFNLLKDKILVFAEDEVIGKCQTNLIWMAHCYDREIASLTLNKIIVNGGLFLGKRKQCVDLFSEMMIEIKGVISRVGNYPNIDQAILNKVIHFGGVENYINRSKEVINFAHYINKFPCETTEKNGLLTIDNYIPTILHQYNRVKPLEQKIYSLHYV